MKSCEPGLWATIAGKSYMAAHSFAEVSQSRSDTDNSKAAVLPSDLQLHLPSVRLLLGSPVVAGHQHFSALTSTLRLRYPRTNATESQQQGGTFRESQAQQRFWAFLVQRQSQ